MEIGYALGLLRFAGEGRSLRNKNNEYSKPVTPRVMTIIVFLEYWEDGDFFWSLFWSMERNEFLRLNID